MKYIKTYELYSKSTGNIVDYGAGDIVICTDGFWAIKSETSLLEKNKKYRVLKIYNLPEDKFLGKIFLRVDVEDIETGDITKGWESTRFKSEMESDSDKYNL